jgi:aminoglycoside phosphotransferase (APT) family kinase protein
LVLCHTDLGGDNMLVDEDGRLSVLDWDYPMLAPPEHDLWSALGEGFRDILDAYRQAGGAWPLHLQHFEFYLLRRYLGDMTARLERILETDNGDEEDAELLRGMEAYGFARWAALDDTLVEIEEALNVAGRG